MREFLQSKIHKAIVTEADLSYFGSGNRGTGQVCINGAAAHLSRRK